ncbi:EamA family transporter [Candidatus Saccharibacteria bacterium]|nr:EamA family transporter [Candidatus Saccharibacteria bacterium]
MPYFLLMINVIIMASGQLFFKRSADFINLNPDLRFPMYYIVNPWFYIAISLFAISTFVWTQVLTKIPLSVAYPIVSSAYILTVLGAAFFFHEQISFLSILGVFFIMTGITLTVLR